MTFNGASAGSFDVVTVNGAVNVGGATLATNGTFTPVPNSGQRFVVHADDAADAVGGTFNGGQFGVVTINGKSASVFHNGGTGNDVELIVTTADRRHHRGRRPVCAGRVPGHRHITVNTQQPRRREGDGQRRAAGEPRGRVRAGKYAIANAATRQHVPAADQPSDRLRLRGQRHDHRRRVGELGGVRRRRRRLHHRRRGQRHHLGRGGQRPGLRRRGQRRDHRRRGHAWTGSTATRATTSSSAAT